MTNAQIIELIGYVGSALVLISFLMVSVVKLRLVNTVGSTIFMVYALIIHSYPTAIMNLCLVLINIRFLWKTTHSTIEYDLVPVNKGEKMVKYILDYYRNDIEKCFPGNSTDYSEANCGYIVCYKSNPVGIMLGTEKDGVLDLVLDYSSPEYRDFSVGYFLMSRLPEYGIKKLTYRGDVKNHKAYLSKIGFIEKKGIYEKAL